MRISLLLLAVLSVVFAEEEIVENVDNVVEAENEKDEVDSIIENNQVTEKVIGSSRVFLPFSGICGIHRRHRRAAEHDQR